MRRPVGFETSEVRWFGTGHLPAPLVDWFSVVPVITEHRCDNYRLDGSVDIGVKRRNRAGLEAKVRRPASGQRFLAGALTGEIEEWTKVTEIDEEELPEADVVVWIEVDKLVRSRIYGLEGARNVRRMDSVDPAVPGCDIELASLRFEGRFAWTFALEAWGPVDQRLLALHLAFGAFSSETPLPDLLSDGLGPAMSYPEWLVELGPFAT